jgi:hypothetical protein
MSQKFRDIGNGLVKINDKSETLQNDKHGNMFVIETGVPEPLRKVKYEVLLGIIDTLKQLHPGESFPISNELRYPVTKMRNLYFPEYKIRIYQTGESYRVFRRA